MLLGRAYVARSRELVGTRRRVDVVCAEVVVVSSAGLLPTVA